MPGVIVLLVVVVLIVIWFVAGYNRLVTMRNRAQEAWSQIDVELKRRHDLIPNLVETAKGYIGHERGTLEAVTQARANAVSQTQSGDPAKIAAAENALTQSLRSLFAVAEAYPDLKAIAAFTQLQEQLTATEDKIEFARRYYNGSVRDFNTSTQRLPTSLIAGMFNFQAMQYFEAEEGDRAVPQVSFDQTPPAAPPPAPPAQS
ncbi:MAG TPA: LemA family protein [Candidatus Dormibacteraeota bacterium]